MFVGRTGSGGERGKPAARQEGGCRWKGRYAMGPDPDRSVTRPRADRQQLHTACLHGLVVPRYTM